MFKAFARVAARSIAIQLEEAAAAAKAKQPYVDPIPKIHQYNAASKEKAVERNVLGAALVEKKHEISTAPPVQDVEKLERAELAETLKASVPPDVQNARPANPYIIRPADGSDTSLKTESFPEASTPATTPNSQIEGRPATANPVTSIPERDAPVAVATTSNSVELDEAPIEPSQAMDDVDTETVSRE